MSNTTLRKNQKKPKEPTEQHRVHKMQALLGKDLSLRKIYPLPFQKAI
jgi:hypothetical protein